MVTALANNPVITTVIPTYQRPRLLERAIRSVLNQTYPRFQVCVYDNASEDETKEVVAKLMKEDPRVKYFCHSSNIGVGPNFNYGLSRIETQYFSILSDDDVLIPNFFESALEKLAHYPNAMLVAGLCLIVDNNAVLAVSPQRSNRTHRNPRFGNLRSKRSGLRISYCSPLPHHSNKTAVGTILRPRWSDVC